MLTGCTAQLYYQVYRAPGHGFFGSEEEAAQYDTLFFRFLP